MAELAAAQIGGLLAAFEHEERAQRLYRETLASLSNALEAKDAVTSEHTEEVVRLAVAVAAELDLGLEAVRNVELGAVLHDIGKVRVPEAILEQARPADRGRVGGDAHAPGGRRADPAADPVARRRILPDRAPPPRALGRHGLPGPARRSRDPARRSGSSRCATPTAR